MSPATSPTLVVVGGLLEDASFDIGELHDVVLAGTGDTGEDKELSPSFACKLIGIVFLKVALIACLGLLLDPSMSAGFTTATRDAAEN